MLEIVDYIDGNLPSDQLKMFLTYLTKDDKDFIEKFRTRHLKKDIDLTIRANLENFCYELSLDKVIDDRTKKIDKILNQVNKKSDYATDNIHDLIKKVKLLNSSSTRQEKNVLIEQAKLIGEPFIREKIIEMID